MYGVTSAAALVASVLGKLRCESLNQLHGLFDSAGRSRLKMRFPTSAPKRAGDLRDGKPVHQVAIGRRFPDAGLVKTELVVDLGPAAILCVCCTSQKQRKKDQTAPVCLYAHRAKTRHAKTRPAASLGV